MDKYNTLYSHVDSQRDLKIRRLEIGFIINELHQILPNYSYPVMKGEYRELDLEATCRDVYPELKLVIDAKWRNHQCILCENRIVVMDGNAKCFRYYFVVGILN